MFPRRRLRIPLLSAAAGAGLTGIVAGIVAACGLTVTGSALPGTDAGDDVAPVGPGDGSMTTIEPPPEDAGTDADSAVPDAARTLECAANDLHGPAMVKSPAGDFCIDSTETTVGEYQAFVDAVGADAGTADPAVLSTLPPSCLPLAPFSPVPAPASAKPNLPVVGVSWCDAVVYCRWAGKHICSGATTSVGRPGEWARACSNDGAQTEPYGKTADTTSCNVSTAGVRDVGTQATCVGGYSGLFDMVGNVGEWVDDCISNDCSRSGGYFASGSGATCALAEPIPRTNKNTGAGIRCCLD